MREGEETNVCLINQTMLEDVGGWELLENRKIFGSEVVGVIGDFHFKDLYELIGNLQIWNEKDVSHLNVRFNHGDISRSIKKIEKIFEKTAPGFAFTYEFYDLWLESHSLVFHEPIAGKVCLQNLAGLVDICPGSYSLHLCSHANRQLADLAGCSQQSNRIVEIRIIIPTKGYSHAFWVV